MFSKDELTSIEYMANLKVLDIDKAIETISEKVGGDVDSLIFLRDHYNGIREKVRKV